MDAREKIIETATRLFSSQGYGSTSLAQVAKEANVSKALIFWHFENKEKLFRSALQRSLEPYFINVVDALDGMDEFQQLMKLVDLYYEFVHDHIESIRLVLSLLLRDEKHTEDPVARISALFPLYLNLLADILESARQKGLVRGDIVPRREASLIMATLNGTLLQRFIDDLAGDTGEVRDLLKLVLIERLRGPLATPNVA